MSSNDNTVIRFSGLKSGWYTYDFMLDDDFFAEQKNEEIEGGNVKVEAKMERKEHLLMFSFHLEGEVTTWCDRCLGAMTVPVEGDEKLCVRFSDTETCDDEDVVVLPEKAFEIDLGQWLYEYVAVRIPMQHMHEEGQCDSKMLDYISPDDEPPASSETDPRWDSLKSLLDEQG